MVSFYYFGIVLVFCFDFFTVGKEGFFVPCWVGLSTSCAHFVLFMTLYLSVSFENFLLFIYIFHYLKKKDKDI